MKISQDLKTGLALLALWELAGRGVAAPWLAVRQGCTIAFVDVYRKEARDHPVATLRGS
ncbi:hypothetical protein [Streptomyces xantholiticus]|uniref:hypothetical protein n=1 Tax=Streptomyces xantholiticus TaxID=68285 RepID=UPI001672B570|nr:hypothetical protein [Streptomyces xantholiticus]GGW72787.1 hypothetical protein GCM10010381_66970 [Streptomyces xantholiticus]